MMETAAAAAAAAAAKVDLTARDTFRRSSTSSIDVDTTGWDNRKREKREENAGNNCEKQNNATGADQIGNIMNLLRGKKKIETKKKEEKDEQQVQKEEERLSDVEDRSENQHHEAAQLQGIDEPFDQVQIEVEEEIQVVPPTIERLPDEHFLNVDQNGTILGSTETITGFPASSLLMTSIFDSVHHEDLIGLHSIVMRFWGEGRHHVEAYFRRQAVENTWVWVVARVVSVMQEPVPAFIMRECRIANEEQALLTSESIRVPAILLALIDQCQSVDLGQVKTKVGGPFMQGDDAMDFSDARDVLDNKEEIQSFVHRENPDPVPPSSKYSVLDSGWNTVSLDLSKVCLTFGAIKLVTLMMTGRLRSEDIKQVIVHVLQENISLEKSLVGYGTLMESQKVDEEGGISPSVRARPKRQSNRRDTVSNLSGRPSQVKRSFKNSSETRIRRKHSSSSSSSNMRHSKVEGNDEKIAQRRRKRPVSDIITSPPPISSMNLSFSDIGNEGIELLSEILCVGTPSLKVLDISFCGIEEKGFLALAQAIGKRKKVGLPSLHGLVLAGNKISYRAAKELGLALSSIPMAGNEKRSHRKRAITNQKNVSGYDHDDESEDDEEDDQDDTIFGFDVAKKIKHNNSSRPLPGRDPNNFLRVMNLSCSSMSSAALHQFLAGLGEDCPIRELCFSSNNMGPDGANMFVSFLEGKGKKVAMPKLDRLDLSNNNLGNDGTSKLTRAILKRVNVTMTELSLSSNNIGALGIETIMDKLLRHNLVRLNLNNNMISDRGCQLVAASLTSMHHLAHLNLSFNQIGCRGVTALMRALVGCESLVSLGLSGNIVKISGAIAMGFALAQHPRLSDLSLDNCCLSQVAQCHIIAGIISNRWVPMQSLTGFQVGPPMVFIGALGVFALNLSNNECFRIQRDNQMKTILQWRKIHSKNGKIGQPQNDSELDNEEIPSQNAYQRMLSWLTKIPFDEDELSMLRKYFYDSENVEGMRSIGKINLEQRGDLLASLSSTVVDEIRDALPVASNFTSSIGLNLDDDSEDEDVLDIWNGGGQSKRGSEKKSTRRECRSYSCLTTIEEPSNDSQTDVSNPLSSKAKSEIIPQSKSFDGRGDKPRMKPRIAMFPSFAVKLEGLKGQAMSLMEVEYDVSQQDVIAQLYAESSLTLLRQLHYQCMNCGLDGWRQGNVRRKILIVDDSKVTRKMVSRAFEKANFIVDTAKNGKEGVEKLKTSIYDIAFMDINMPVMNGFDATRALRAWEDVNRPGARQPICALTAAYVDDFERSELMKFKEAGLDVMESKPCNIPRLFKVVDDVSPMFSDLCISINPTIDSVVT